MVLGARHSAQGKPIARNFDMLVAHAGSMPAYTEYANQSHPFIFQAMLTSLRRSRNCALSAVHPCCRIAQRQIIADRLRALKKAVPGRGSGVVALRPGVIHE